MNRTELRLIVFWGALWGLSEATIGQLLHLLPVNIGWMFWFPIAFFFMTRVWRESGRPAAAFGAALLAGGVKLTNLMSAVPVDRVVNPAVAIVLEGLVIFAALEALSRVRQLAQSPVTLSFGLGICWRALFLGYLFLIPASWPNPTQLTGIKPMLTFVLVESAVNALLIFPYFAAILRRTDPKPPGRLASYPAVSTGLLALSIVFQWVVWP